mgnify:CR=1 FL=1
MLDDLLSIASKTMEGFNPATDSVDDFEKLYFRFWHPLNNFFNKNQDKELLRYYRRSSLSFN